MAKKIEALHALNWYYGNICSRKYPEEKPKSRYGRMREIIKGHEEYLITHWQGLVEGIRPVKSPAAITGSC